MTERELITVAFGNFATLVATQWVNGTTRYDVEHTTLYTDAHIDDTVTGRACGSTGSAQRTRVPRLLLLDDSYDGGAYCRTLAPLHCMDSLTKPPAKEKNHDNDEEEEDAEQEEDVMTRWVQSAQRRWWRRPPSGNHDDNDDDDEDEPSQESSDEEAEAHTSTRGRGSARALRPWMLRDAPTPHRPTASPSSAPHRQHRDPSTTQSAEEPQHQASDSSVSAHEADDACGAVPWWRFITTSLHRRSVLTRSPQQQREAGMQFHKFGHGLMNNDDYSSGGSAAAHAGLSREVTQDALRHQLEDSDRTQGLQCFSEGNSMFGGCAHRTLHDLWDDAGAKLSVVHVTLFTPPPWALYDTRTQAAHDVTALNRLLATSMLSAPESVVCVPLELTRWEGFFGGATAPAWLRCEQAVAQYVAAMADTTWYGARDGALWDEGLPSSSNRNRAHVSRYDENTDTSRTVRSAFYLDEWCRALRPAPSLRITAALGALPLSLSPHPPSSCDPVAPHSLDYDDSTRRHSALALALACRGVPRHRGAGYHVEEEGGQLLWRWLTRCSPLLTSPVVEHETAESAGVDGLVALTHAVTRRADTEAGRVVGHAFSLRGVGGDAAAAETASSPHSSHHSAMLRYAQAVGQGDHYIPLVSRHYYPCSTTFPRSLLHTQPVAGGDRNAQDEEEEGEEEERERNGGVGRTGGVRVASHVINTYGSAPMLREVVTQAEEVWRTRGHRYRDGFGLERDDWTERLEEVWQMYDDYNHGEPTNPSSDDDEYGVTA